MSVDGQKAEALGVKILLQKWRVAGTSDEEEESIRVENKNKEKSAERYRAVNRKRTAAVGNSAVREMHIDLNTKKDEEK